MDIESIREALTLPLLAGDEPFGLAETENFGPDEWAWLFLSMNQDYAKAFEKHANSGLGDNAALQAFCEDSLNANVIPDHDGTCRSRFGLAAWINPSLERLPRLRNDGSWFFPLMSPVPENHLRKEVSDVPFVPPPRPPNPSSPYLQSVETPFGYLATRTVPRSSTHSSAIDSWELAWVAIDCSVPPEGQIRAISWLLEHHRKQLQGFSFKTYDDADTPRLIAVRESDVFSHMQFKRAAGVGSQTNPADCWFAICIDVLGPVVSQINEYAKLLHQKHQELVDGGLAYSPLASRFMNTLPTMEGRNGGFRLKALHILSELNSWGHTHEIDKIIGAHRLSTGHSPAWRKNFSDNIERYVQEGQALIDGDYRWLIHTQKPVFASR